MNITLENKNAIVCGSSRGIGREIAVLFAELGASVTLVGRNKNSLEELRSELHTSASQQHCVLIADFQFPEQLQTKLQKYLETANPQHILVNNTGGPPAGPIIDADLNQFDRAFTAHLKCNHILAQNLAPGMKKMGYGRIINIVSTSVKQPIAGLGVSNTIRGAVGNWAKTLAGELGPFGITVNNILPGATATQRLNEIISGRAAKKRVSLEKEKEIWLQSIPARRFADARETAYAAAFLAGNCASYINGINLPVDGGRLKCL